MGNSWQKLFLGCARSQPGLLQYGAHVPRFISSMSPGQRERDTGVAAGRAGLPALHEAFPPCSRGVGHSKDGQKVECRPRQDSSPGRNQSKKERYIRALMGQVQGPGPAQFAQPGDGVSPLNSRQTEWPVGAERHGSSLPSMPLFPASPWEAGTILGRALNPVLLWTGHSFSGTWFSSHHVRKIVPAQPALAGLLGGSSVVMWM